MHELYDDLEDMCEILSKELSKTNEKLEKSGGQITSGDVEYIDKLTHAIKSIKTTKAMIESEDDYSGSRYRYDRNHMNYSRDRERGMRRNHYSSENADDNIISELRELMDDASNEETRMEIKKLISKMERR